MTATRRGTLRGGGGKTMLLIFTVFNVFATVAHGQSYLFTLENVLTRQQLPYNLTGSINGTTEPDLFAVDQVDNNTRIILYKNPVVESNELSQTAMDVITIVWYVATFLALAAFFMLMACSDRRCRDMRGRQAGNGNANETQRAPPTPSPSYSEFAPPSYDTVIKMQHAAKTSIFVIPFEGEGNNNKANSNSNNNTDESITTSAVSILPASVYTIDERPKLDK